MMKTREQLLLLFALICIISASLRAAGQGDTAYTVTLNLNKNKPAETIRLEYNDSTAAYTIKIGADIITGKFEEAFMISVEALDIDRNSENKLLAVKAVGYSDFMECSFYQRINNKFVPCGHIDYSTGLATDGDNILRSTSWMGFWTLTEEYIFNSGTGTLTKRPKDTYPVSDAQGKVTESFKLKKERSDNSETSGTLKAGTKIKIIKADISPKCKDESGNDDSYNCFWYYFKASDGTEGWCRMKDFQQKVDGLPWAG
jgi:hypothetical protein